MLYGYGIGFLGYFTSALTVPAFRLRDLLTLGVITVFSSLSVFILYLSFAILSPRSLCLSLSRLTLASFGIPKPVFSISHLYSPIPCLRHLPQSFLALLLLLTPLLPSFAILFLDLLYLCLLISLFSFAIPSCCLFSSFTSAYYLAFSLLWPAVAYLYFFVFTCYSLFFSLYPLFVPSIYFISLTIQCVCCLSLVAH